jgi:hypothetical protein
MRLFFLLVLVSIWFGAHAQVVVLPDSARLAGDTTHSAAESKKDGEPTKAKKESYWGKPQKAALYSAILPGLGQAYNHQAWKMPILYAGAGFLAYLWSSLDVNYHKYDAAVNDLAAIPARPNPYPQYTQSQIVQIRDYYRRNRDYTIIISTLVYMLQIADAHVFAHLRGFNVNNNLSFQPTLLPTGSTSATGGVSITYQIK